MGEGGVYIYIRVLVCLYVGVFFLVHTQALHLDRSSNARVTVYQDWLEAPEYPAKSEADILAHTVKDLSEVRALLEGAARPGTPPLYKTKQPP